MTEQRGSSAGWRTTAMVAPAAAAAFAVATGWAVQHPPATASTSTPATVSTPAAPVEPPFAVDRAQVSLQNRAQALHSRVTRLERVLARLRARTEAVRQAPLPAGGSGAQPGTGVSAPGYSGGGSAVAPPPVAAAPAPATHTSTGASGAR